MKLCSKCNQEKPKADFQGRRSWCSSCNKLYHKARYETMKVTKKILPEKKKCSFCKLVKFENDFARKCDSIDGLHYRCKDCDYKARGCLCRHKPQPINLSDLQIAYLAGLIDGEGHVCLSRTRRTQGNFKGNHFLHARLIIANTSPEFLSIQKDYNLGKIHHVKSKKPNHKNRIDWRITANQCRTLLPKIIPYLYIRKRQAELLLEYLKLADHRDRTTEYQNKVTDIYKQIKALNKRGT